MGRLRSQVALLLLDAVVSLVRAKLSAVLVEAACPVEAERRPPGRGESKPWSLPDPPRDVCADGYVNVCRYIAPGAVAPPNEYGVPVQHTHMDRDGWMRPYEGAECISWPPKVARV